MAPVDALTTGFELVETPAGHRVPVLEDWWLFAGPNGGWALGAAAALSRALDDRPLRSLQLRYLAMPTVGSAVMTHRDIRLGRSLRTVGVDFVQADKIFVTGTLACGTDRDGPTYDDENFPDVAPPDPHEATQPSSDQGVGADPDGGSETSAPTAEPAFSKLWERQNRLGDPPGEAEQHGPDAIEERGGMGEVGGWIRPRSLIEVDAIRLAAMTDSWYPPFFRRVKGNPITVGAPTTVDLTVHLFGDPPPDNAGDWWFLRSTTQVMRSGYCDMTTHVWHRSGRLAAVAHQLMTLVKVA